MPGTPAKRILFIASNCIGDAVLATGILAYLVDAYPDALFTIACGPLAAGLFRAVPRLERIQVLRKQSWKRHWTALWRHSVGTRWELVVDLRNSLISRLLVTRRRVAKLRNTGQHKVIEHARILGLTQPPMPKLWLDAEAENAAEALLATLGQTPLIAFGPGANWPPKQWPIEHFIALARQLTGVSGPVPGAAILVVAGARERSQCEALFTQAPEIKFVDAIGQDLLTVAACLKRCQLYVGNDSGPMHMAVAMGVPTLGLFGPGYEMIFGPWGPKGKAVRTPESREELLTRLTHPDGPCLMDTLTAETVTAAAAELLHG